MKPLCQKPAGRVERSAAATNFAPETIDLAVVAHGCHGHLRRSLAFQTASKRVSLSPEAISCGYTGVVAWLML